MLYMIEYARYDKFTNVAQERGFVASKDNTDVRLVQTMYIGNAIYTDNPYREQKGIVRYVSGIDEVLELVKLAKRKFPELQFHIKKEN